jgi:signal transduction histidine kinase
MIKKLISYFIPADKKLIPELSRKYNLIVSIILITILFQYNYALITVIIGMKEGTWIMLSSSVLNFIILFSIRTRISHILITNIYILVNVLTVDGCIYYSGGFNSPVLPWLASSPIVALLMAGKRTGIFWVIVNALTALAFGALDKQGYIFPVHYDVSWANMFFTNCFVGLILIIFFVSLVFENGKNAAQKKLAEQSLLLAEEKKKTALNNISMELHDNVGQSLSLIKTNLHLIDILKEQKQEHNLKDSVELLGDAIQKLRNISHDLYTDNTNKINVIDFIKAELETAERMGNYKTEFIFSGNYKSIDSQTEFILTRVFKEALNNIIKHSNANSIKVRIVINERSFMMQIEDNGKGMDIKNLTSKGQGIKSMYSRVHLVGGEFDIRSSLGNGAILLVNIPIDAILT